MQGDGCKRLIFLANQHMLFSLQGLMQTLGVAAAFHNAARKFVNNFYFAINHNVINIAMEHKLSLQGLLQMIRQLPRRIAV